MGQVSDSLQLIVCGKEIVIRDKENTIRDKENAIRDVIRCKCGSVVERCAGYPEDVNEVWQVQCPRPGFQGMNH